MCTLETRAHMTILTRSEITITISKLGPVNNILSSILMLNPSVFVCMFSIYQTYLIPYKPPNQHYLTSLS